MSEQPSPVQWLREDFRRHLEALYAALHLAPPYHSVEQAIGHLATALQAMPQDEQRRVRDDPVRRWELYRTAFVDSGLNKKHRGIIADMVRSGKVPALPPSYRAFLDAIVG